MVDACEVRVHYDGMAQPVRDGADFRVFVPRDWTGDLYLHTDDVELDTDYPRRSDIVVAGAMGDVIVESMGSGEVQIEMGAEVKEVPAWDADQLEACAAEDWPSEDFCDGDEDCSSIESAGACVTTPGCDWNDCPCAKPPVGFGRIRIDTLPGRAADITIELPPDLWANVVLENDAENHEPEEDPQAECSATVDCADFGKCEVAEETEACAESGNCWVAEAELNEPDPEPLSGGFVVRATSSSCGEVPTAHDPSDFEAPYLVQRGDLRVCSDCLDLPIPPH
jgi:hypothetical protein